MNYASKPVRVLLVEDNPGDAVLVRRALAFFGSRFVTQHVESLAQALPVVEGHKVDVVLLDLSLPDSQGIETVARVASSAPWMPIIILTGYDDESFALKAVEAGAQDYLVKGQADGELLKRSIGYAIRRKQMEERMKSIIDLASDAIIVTDEDHRVTLFNPSAERMFGWSANEVLGQPIDLLMPATIAGEIEDAQKLGAFLVQDVKSTDRRDAMALHRSGREFPVEIGISEGRSHLGGFFTAIVRDVSDRRRMEEELRRMAATDPLTGLPNRREFMSALGSEWERARRYGHPSSLLMVDIDHFKKVNDLHGHAAGDEALRQLAECMRGELRTTDLPARLGGEEFAVLLPMTDALAAIEIAERLRQRVVATIISWEDKSFSISISVGVACVDSGSSSSDACLARADAALYRAKQTGRNKVVSDVAMA